MANENQQGFRNGRERSQREPERQQEARDEHQARDWQNAQPTLGRSGRSTSGQNAEDDRYYGSPSYAHNERPRDWYNSPSAPSGEPWVYRQRPEAYRAEAARGEGYGRDAYRGRSFNAPADWGGSPYGQHPAYGPGEHTHYGQHHAHPEGIGQQLGDAGRKLIGKVKRLVRNPKNYKRSDERIREDVCDRLASSEEVDPSDVEVSVSNGEVTLTGTVQSRHAKFIVEETADDVPGVHEIHNQLRIHRPDERGRASSEHAEPSEQRDRGRHLGRS